MTFTAGTKLGTYEIVGPLGAGVWVLCTCRSTSFPTTDCGF